MVELRRAAGSWRRPVLRLVVGDVEAAVGAEQHLVRDSADRSTARGGRSARRSRACSVNGELKVLPPSVETVSDQARLVDRVVILRVDDHVGEVERAHADVERGVHLAPASRRCRRSGRARSSSPRRPRRPCSAATARPRPRCARARPSGSPVGRASSRSRRRPSTCRAPLPLPPELKKSGLAAELPHAGVEDRRLLRIEREVGAAGVGVDVEHLLPGLAAVGRLVDAALLVRAPQLAGGADVDRVRRLGIDLDAGDALGVLQPDVCVQVSPPSVDL